MNFKKSLTALPMFALLLTACAQSIPEASPVYLPAHVTSPLLSPIPAPIEPTGILQPVPTTESSNVPYYDRKYRLLDTCNADTCLFFDDVMNPPYPLGYAQLLGHYVNVTRANLHGETEACDGFIIDDGPKELLAAYAAYYSGDTSVFSQTLDGKPIINIPLFDQDEMTKAIVLSSSITEPIELRIVSGPPIMRGVVSCFSPVNIVGVFKPPTTSQLSQQWTISEADNNKTFTYTLTSRFTVELSDAQHPLSQLKCEPKPIFGYISNGSSGDPSKYPIRYEITETGRCQLQNGDFHVTIVGVP